ncbi:MAG: 50S ribosomal protein L23 [Gammaproteobacteria bacterium]|nr:50S ribosomal protein L23 [Gammaproteobacteria bacterium]
MNHERLLRVLVAPHISEKGTRAADTANQHVFKVLRDASKLEIKKAVETLFSVQVEQVRVLNMKGKSKRFQQALGRRQDWKKAYVTLAKGQDIRFNGGE